MSKMRTFDDTTTLTQELIETTIAILRNTIMQYGVATWGLSGGTTPLAAYERIVANHSTDIDWSKVSVFVGDERVGPLDGPDNNWRAIDAIIGNLPTAKLRPLSDRSSEEAAREYTRQLQSLPLSSSNTPRIDLLWLGVGEDSHTLSLFPGHIDTSSSGDLVIPIHHAPKPPVDRISLSLDALSGVTHALVIATGENKRQAVSDALSNIQSPIGRVVSSIEQCGGTVELLVDSTASPNN
ncbi:6-phosphogluconolactonase [Candidatus Saccharibacteria bacterium]|nr:6-phosphogluconolactonase [Candidatus Saccharibacteria bacterium]